MTRKDYVTLAAALVRAYKRLDNLEFIHGYNTAYEALEVFGNELETTLLDDNPRFDRAKFKEAYTP